VSAVNQADLQGNILCGYGRDYPSALFLFFRVGDPVALRRWLAQRLPQVTTAEPWGAKPPSTLNVAFGFEGLRRLGLGERVLAGFPDDFTRGMEDRAEQLGDVDDSAPARWEPGLRGAHGVITVWALTPQLRDDRRLELEAEAARAGFEVTRAQPTDVLPGGREPFGFRDGISQPTICDPRAGPWRRWPADVPVKPGEFVLGYRDEGGSTPPWPAEVGMSGSYMVVRKLEQDVEGFRAFVREEAGAERADWLAAKLVGRWPDGTPLVRAPDAPEPERAEDLGWLNAFTYGSDPGGRRCPIGAHIRRAHPRDSLDADWRFSNRHRIIRRGMPYAPDRPGGRPGLVFVCYQASIARQFEFIQSEWCGDGNAFGLGSDPDFIAGPAQGKMTVQGDPPTFVPMRRLVTTRGGGYFFAPGIEALRHIAGADEPRAGR
jgi:Dyp-type peroxidase family